MNEACHFVCTSALVELACTTASWHVRVHTARHNLLLPDLRMIDFEILEPSLHLGSIIYVAVNTPANRIARVADPPRVLLGGHIAEVLLVKTATVATLKPTQHCH